MRTRYQCMAIALMCCSISVMAAAAAPPLAFNHRIFSAGDNGKLVVLDTKTGLATGSVAIVPKVDQIAFDAVGGLVYCAGTDKMSVVRTTGGKVVALGNVTTAATARNVTVDPATRWVWTTYTDGKSSFAKAWMPPDP